VSVVQFTVEVDAPIDRVWAVVADPRNLPRWDHRILRVSGLPEDGLRQGSEYRVQLGFMGARAWVPAKVLDIRPSEYSCVHLGGLVDAVVESRLKPLPGGRTRLSHRIDYRFPGGPLGSLAAGAVSLLGAPLLLRHGVEAQKRQAEEGVTDGATDGSDPEAGRA
jgi:uncharacterized membrane protein